MKMPTVGERLRVTTSWTDLFAGSAFNVPRHYTLEGRVVASQEFDNPNTFRLFTGNPRFPESVVPLDRVTAVLSLTGDTPVMQDIQPVTQPEDTRTFQVEGSKGDTYVVVYNGKNFTCTCKAGQMGRLCRHVKDVRAEFNI